MIGVEIDSVWLRRRVFWALFYLSTRTSWVRQNLSASCVPQSDFLTSLAQVYNLQYSHFNFSQIDCKLPLDCSDEELLLDERAVRATVRGRTTVHNSFPTKMSPLLVSWIRRSWDVDRAMLTFQHRFIAGQVPDRDPHEEERELALLHTF